MKNIKLVLLFGERRSQSVHMRFIETEHHSPKPEEQSIQSTFYYIKK